MSCHQTLAQRRAAHALGRIKKRVGEPCGNYVNYAEALPAAILMNGLGQAAATLLSKATNAHRLLYDDLQDWLCGGDAAAPYRGAATERDRLMQSIIRGSERDYLCAQTEALAYLVWLKKFANAHLERGTDE